MTTPLLYSFRRCPYAIRARLGIFTSETPVRLREIELKNKPQPMLDASPKGTVPVLIVTEQNQQQVIDESLDIMLWALSQNDPQQLLLDDKIQYQDSLSLIARNDSEFKYWLDRYKYADRFPEHTQDDYFEQAQVFLKELESRLNQNSFLFGDAPTIADIAIFPFIRQFAFVDKAKFDNLKYPKLQFWLQHWLKHPWFDAVMPKFQPWLDEQQEYALTT